MRIHILVALFLLCGCNPKPESNPTSQPISGHCGFNDNAIINGKSVDEGSRLAKGLVAITSELGGARPELCTGALIAPNLVITAAHCVSGDPSKTKLYFSTAPDCGSSQSASLRSPKRIIRHHGYDDETHQSDLALIFLEANAPEGAQPFTLSFDRNDLGAETPIQIAGYGLQKDLGEVQTAPTALKTTTLFQAPEEAEARFLFLDAETGSGPCQGDSGGPAFVQKGESFNLVGVASYVFDQKKEKRTCLSRAAYTRIASYQAWLFEASQGLISVDEE